MRPNIMLKATYQIALQKEKELHIKLSQEMPKEIHDSYESGGYWHDNPHWDNMLLDQERLSTQLKELRESLASPQFIDEMRISAEYVSIGTLVTVKFLDTGETEDFYILGPLDLLYNPSCQGSQFISVFAPLAQPLIGKKSGEQVRISLPSGVRELEIVKIGKLPIEDFS